MDTEAICQEKAVLRYEDITRPPIPPRAFPAIYSPVIFPLFRGWTSSEIYARETEVAPESKNPLRALSATSRKNEGE